MRATHLPVAANSDRRFDDFPVVNRVGATERFEAYYERAMGETGRFAAAAVLNRAERDLATVCGWFGTDAPAGPYTIVLGRLPGDAGARWQDGDVLSCDLPVVPQAEPLQVSFFVAALLAERHAREAGWAPDLAGVVARCLAAALYPRRIAGFATGWVWLEGERPDLLAGPLDTAAATGCGALYVHYLHHQLGVPWTEVVARPEPTLAALGARLGGSFVEFRALVDQALPVGESSKRPVDNVFPVFTPASSPPVLRPAPATSRGRRVCLLTGASGTLGRHLCERYADRYDFAAVHLTRAPAGDVHPICADLTIDGEPERVVALTLERFGRIDLVVNAAVSSTWGPMLSSEPLWSSAPLQFVTNVVVPLRVASAAGRLCWSGHESENRAAGRNVVNVSSVSGQNLYPGEGQSVYAASKAALDHLTGHMALEFEPLGVRVNAVAPNSFPANVATARVAEAVIDLDGGAGTGSLVVVDGEQDRVIALGGGPVGR